MHINYSRVEFISCKKINNNLYLFFFLRKKKKITNPLE